MRPLRSLPLCVLASALLCGTAAMAQNSTTAARITTDVDESSLTTLKGNVPLLARAQYDQGEASPSTQLTHVRLVLSRSSEQQAALDKYLAELQDKSSPNYHKWLTPEQFGKLYGPADSDVAALVAWLESHGLKLETVSTGRTNIAFSGSVSQVEETFHTSIHSFAANGSQFYSNTTDPKIPTALAPVVKGVAHLNTIRPKPHFQRGSAGKFNPQTKRMEPANGPGPSLTGGSGTTAAPYFLYIVPGDAATIYDTPNSFNANYSSGTSYTGEGVIIGVGGDATISTSIVANGYRSMFLGNTTTPSLYYCTSSSPSSCSSTPGTGYNAGDADEAYIDTELSGGIAPGATIYYYASTDLNSGIEAALTANVVDIFSLSFGECEQDMSTSDNALINGWWEEAAGQGIAVTVSTGDSGSAGCDYPTNSKGKNVTDAVGGLAVSGFASTPYNIAVGGTDFYPLNSSFSSFSTYVSTSSGSSSTYYRTALGSIPESAWNDSTTTLVTGLSANVPWTGSSANIVAGSGGASSCATGSGATCAGYPKPSWQTGTGVPSDGKRDLPDVSLMAGNGNDDATWVVCDDETTTYNSQTVTLDCEVQSDGYWFTDGYGGTSTAAPAFAGILALVQQKTGSRLGQAAKELYTLFNNFNYPIFHYVQVGNNSVPCTSGTPNCALNSAGYYFESGYNTATNYSLATGMGSVDATQLVNHWSTTTSLATPTVAITAPTPNPVTTAQSLSVPVSVTGSSGTPTGTVTLTGGGYTSAAETLSSGSYTFTVPAGSLAIGSDTLTASYTPDAASSSTYNSATGSNSVTVTAAPAATTGAATAITASSATLAGTVNPNGADTHAWFLYGTSSTLAGASQTTSQDLGSGTTASPVSANLSGLTASTTYSFRVVAQNTTGTTDGAIDSFTTAAPPQAPAATTGSASAITASSATLAGTVNPNGADTHAWFLYGTSSTLSGASQTTSQDLGSGTTASPVTANLSGLTASTTYYFRVVAQNTTGTTNGAIDSFTTTAIPFTLAGTAVSVAPGATTGNTSTITVTPGTGGFTGMVSLSCAISPPAASDPATCSIPASVTLSGATAQTATLTVYTTAPTSAALVYPKRPGVPWYAAGGATLACILLFGIPARRRKWRTMLGMVVLLAAISACALGCGGGGGGGGGGGNLGTTAGNYTITVTGTSGTTTETSPAIALTVQ